MNLQFFETLVPALLHTFWIGLLSASLLFVALRVTPGERTRLRYALGLMALLTIFIGGLLAWELPKQQANSSIVIMQERYSSSPDHSSVSESSIAPVAFPPNSPVLHSVGKRDWRRIAGMVWMVGAVLSLLRLLHISWDIQRLVRQSRAIENPVVQQVVTELSKVAGLSRRVLILTGEHIIQPAVIGIFRPIIFLPLSVVTGLPEWQLRAILAHELAHIVRHDFLANALQLLAETILFFNPTVWWINRRIREEREACCDALASEWIDSKTALAETLLEQAIVHSSALPAFGGPNPGSLKNRILRLINPAQQSTLKLPWKSLLLVALFAAGGLILAKQGTSKMVGYLKRLHALEIARDEYATPTQKIALKDTGGFKEIILEGTLRGEDGNRVPIHQMSFYFQSGRGSCWHYLYKSDFAGYTDEGLLRFRKKLEYSRVEYFFLQANGYAPFQGMGGAADTNGVLTLPTITLKSGFDGQMRFVKPSGETTTNVHVVSQSYDIPQGSVGRRERDVQFGEQGVMIFPHCNEFPVELEVMPPDGYQLEKRLIAFKPDKVVKWKLKPAPLTEGVVVDENGASVTGAKLFLAEDYANPLYAGDNPLDWGNQVAETDANGRFRFSCLEKDKEYMFVILAPGYLRKRVDSYDLSFNNKQFTLFKGGTLDVHVLNRNLLKKSYMWHTYPYERDHSRDSYHYDSSWGWCKRIEETETTATYRLTHLMEGNNRLIFGHEVNYEFNAEEVSDSITVDIAELLEKKPKPSYEPPIPVSLTLRLVPPKNEPMPSGMIKFSYGEGRMGRQPVFPIPQDGVITTNLMVSPESWRGIEVTSENMTGYVVSESIPVTSKIDMQCRLRPAGGVVLTCVDSKGKPLTGYYVNVQARFTERKGSSTSGDYLNIQGKETDKHTCIIEPLDLEKEYKINVTKHRKDAEGGTLNFETNWLSLSKSRPVKKIKCVLKPVKNQEE